MIQYTSDDVASDLANAPVDPRTGNRVLYNVSWIADKNSMIGERNEDWVRRELDWFASGSDSLDDMEAPVPQAFQACAGKDNRVNSAYGHILFGKGANRPYHAPIDGLSLADTIVDTFIKKGKHTRHAVAIISDRDIHALSTSNGRNDFICTNALNVMIDHEDNLHIIAQMRSMDAVWGYRADWSMWDYLMEWLLGSLEMVYPELKRGNITFQVANLHVYPRHFDLLQRWADKIYDDQEREMRRVWMDRAQREQVATRGTTDPHHNEPAGTGEAPVQGRLF